MIPNHARSLSPPPVEIAFRTDPGRDPDKQVNEDAAAYLETRLGFLAIVCDGMGGHAGGREASELAVRTIGEIVQSAPDATAPRDALRVAIEEANRRVWAIETGEGGYRPGSTVVALLAHAGGAEIAHVGDSRIYLVHAGAIGQVTKDHSMVQEMVDRNIIKAEDAAKHPDANKIMRALGIAKDVEVDVRPEPIAYSAGDVFVLCSDGLSDLVGPSEILDIAGSRPAAQAAGQLVDLANARGGHDNITAMVLRMKGSAAAVDHPTIVKTVALTAHDGQVGAKPSADHGSGPRGTVLSAPIHASSSPVLPSSGTHTAIGSNVGAPLPAPAYAAGTTERPRPHPPGRDRPPSHAGARSKVGLIAGILLAVAALAIAGALVWTQQRPKHRAVPIVELDAARPSTTSTEEDDDAGSVAPEVTLSPVLAPPSGVKVPWWKDPDAATPTGEPRDCARARWQKDAGRPPSSYEPLEAKCRAAGGKI